MYGFRKIGESSTRQSLYRKCVFTFLFSFFFLSFFSFCVIELDFGLNRFPLQTVSYRPELRSSLQEAVCKGNRFSPSMRGSSSMELSGSLIKVPVMRKPLDNSICQGSLHFDKIAILCKQTPGGRSKAPDNRGLLAKDSYFVKSPD